MKIKKRTRFFGFSLIPNDLICRLRLSSPIMDVSSWPVGKMTFREWSERDYGIDAVIEIFDNGYPTGKIAFIQIKGTSKTIMALKIGAHKGRAVSCGNVSNSSLDYARQDKIPMILVYVSLAEPKCFYYVDLQSQIDDIESRRKNEEQEVHTVHIPIENYAENDLSGFFELIDSYYDR